MKLSKKAISFLLAAVMVLSCFAVAIPFISFDALAADITIDGVSQTQIVKPNDEAARDAAYENYAARYLNGASRPTDIVIPGLDPAQDYVIQGMTYYPDRDWMLVTAYHNVADGETTQSSKVFALDAATGDFVAMFSFINVDGTTNTDHGGGIAVSEHNIYYSCGDKDRKIAYAPLSALANAPLNEHTEIQLVAEKDFVEIGSISSDSKTGYSAYVCYDEGILWVGNFFDKGAVLAGMTIAAADYNAPSNKTYNSMVFGYELRGNSSAEEWDYLMGKFRNLVKVTTASGKGSSNGSELSWEAHQNQNGCVTISGTITAPTAYVSEYNASFGSVYLTEGQNYTIEFTSTNDKTDLYMFAPPTGNPHSNVKQSSQTKITKLENGLYHYSMDFTAGLKPAGADSSWPTTQSTDGSYTGTYTMRFDQDSIAAGETREFSITNIKVSPKNTHKNAEAAYDEGSVGSPSYAIGLNNALKDVQYATVDNGKLYLSRSYGSGAGNSIRFGFGDSSYLTVADIDLSVPGTKEITISTTSTGSLDKTIMAYDISEYDDYPMMPMSEGLCVIDGDIFITFEGASNKYLNESSGLTSIGNCEKPVDVIWQLDPYDLMEVTVAEPEKSIYYEKVDSVSEIKSGDEYIIVHESREKDPVTQKPYLYAFDAFGNFKDYKLTKSTASVVKGYDGMISHPISYYSLVEDEASGKTRLYLDNPEIDDVENIRWTLEKVNNVNIEGRESVYRIKSTEPYFANYNCFYFDADQITMAPSTAGFLNNIEIVDSGNGKGGFWFANADQFFLWCNEGNYNSKISTYYAVNSSTTSIYSGITEQSGTFHCDALNQSGKNIIGGQVPANESYRDGVMNIYRRVVDDVASTYESRVYTNLTASLQANGTYTVDLETYAISPNHYKHVGERPTDYIIVADTAQKMLTPSSDAEKGSTGISSFNGGLAVSSLSQEADTNNDGGVCVKGYAFSNPDEDIYFLHTDGRYYKIYLAVATIEYAAGFIGIGAKMNQRYWAYYVADDGLYYVLQSSEACGGTDGAVYAGITEAEFKNHVDNSGTLGNSSYYSSYSTDTANGGRREDVVFKGPHYRFDNIHSKYTYEHTPIETLKNAASNLVDQIAAQNSNNRIALVQYGADASTGHYNTSGTLITGATYTDAFWSASAENAAALKTKINAITTSTQTSNTGIEMERVNNIIDSSGVDYTADGTRNLAIIFISDGIPGADDTKDTTGAANAVVAKALTAKNKGAFIYTVLVGNNTSGLFDKKTYMDAVSSKYPAASSIDLDSLGGESTDGVNYALNLATCSINNFVFFGSEACEEVAHNNAVGLDNLDKNSYLREQLSDAFIFPDDWTEEKNLKAYYVKGDFDAIGRFSFNEDGKTDATDIVTSIDKTTRTVTVTNYDYSTKYIARGNDGKKLKVTITGLLPNGEEGKIENTSINNTETTALYKTKAIMDDPDGEPFKYLPTEYFNIPTYNFTLDFGFDMLDTDVNGTLCAVSDSFSVQDPDHYVKATENGMFKIEDGDKNLIYSLDPETPNSKGYVLIKRDEGEHKTNEYDWFCIQLAPASNVYYEQNGFNIDTEKTVTAGDNGEGKWTSVGKQNFTYQLPENPETDIHGWDENYAKEDYGHSNGVADKVVINSSNRKSDTQTFSFYGTGFDLVSACGTRTGVLTVTVTDKDGKLVKAYLVDTYYNDTNFMVQNPDSPSDQNSKILYQVPVVSFVNDDKDEDGKPDAADFTVKVTAVYLTSSNALKPWTASVTETNPAGEIEATSAVAEDDSAIYDELAALGMNEIANSELELVWFDENSILNGGTGAYGAESDVEMAAESNHRDLSCYLDGFRTYHPLGTGDSANANYILSEQNAEYINVINNVNKGITPGTDNIASLAYVVRGGGDTLAFADYQTNGPQNELYLKPGSDNALAFTVQLKGSPSKVHLGLRAVTGEAKVKIGGTEFEIDSATEMYYDITECITVNPTTGMATITIQNMIDEANGYGMLAVNNIKITQGGAVAAVSEDDLSMYALSMSAPAEEAYVVNGRITTEKVEEELPPETEEPIEKTPIEKVIDFIKYAFAQVVAFFSDVFVFLTKGGIF